MGDEQAEPSFPGLKKLGRDEIWVAAQREPPRLLSAVQQRAGQVIGLESIVS